MTTTNNLSCFYIPPTGKVKPKLPKITCSGPDVAKREMAERACRRKFTFSLIPKTTEWLKIGVLDGKGKSSCIEIYDMLGSIRACTCEEYFEQQAGWCVHLAALDGIEKRAWSSDQNLKAWLVALGRERIKIPMHPRLYQAGVMYYDSWEESRKIIGRSPVASDNMLAWQKRNVPSQLVSNLSQPLNVSSAGLLTGVTLFGYQEDIFKKMLGAKRGICSMVVGSGKTITTIACWKHLLNQNDRINTLVISPKSLCMQWANEIKRTTGKIATIITKPEQLVDAGKKPGEVSILTYQYATRKIDDLKKIKWDLVVVDEIQFVRNNDTKTWKALSQIKSEYFYGLSGTVVENRLDDFYSIMEIAAPGKLGPRWKFNHFYQNVLMSGTTKVIYSGVKNLDDLKSKVSDHVWFYDKLVLPPITHQNIYVTCNKEEKLIHDEYREKARLLIAKSMNQQLSHIEKMLLQSFLLKARQAANAKELITKNKEKQSNKITEYLKILDGVLNKGEKLVVFSEWTEYLALAKRETDALGVGSVVFTGAQNIKARDQAVKDFQSDPNIKIFYASDAGGIGLDGLQLVANNVLHLELPWNPSKLDQRTGRVYRTRQTKPVTAFYLISLDTIETSIEALLKSKRDTRNQTLQSFA